MPETLENQIKVTQRLVTASRKAIQSATPSEVLEIWKFIKIQQLKRIHGLTSEQVQSLVETQARELGTDCIATSTASTDTNLLQTSPPDSNYKDTTNANGIKAKTTNSL